mgnify:CR=1 FL=1
MATNFKQPGEVLTLTAPYQRDSGQGALVGAIFGVALSTVANGVAGEFSTEGVWELAKTSAQAWTAGARVFWNTSTKVCDSDPTTGPFIGTAVEAAADPSSTGIVRLNGSAPAQLEGAQGTVADIATADADGTYGSPEATLINELKTQLNSLLAKLRTAGIIASS